MPDPDWEPDDDWDLTPEPGKSTKKEVLDIRKELKDYEGGVYGGHTEAKHVAKGKQWVEDRIPQEGVKKSTSYRNYDEANAIVKDVIERKADDIADWLNKPIKANERPKDFTVEYGESVGYGKEKGKPFKNDIKEATVWIKKTKDGYEVITSYPVYK